MARGCVVFSVLGTNLDAGVGKKRWDRWRPTVGLCQQEDLLVTRLELLHGREHTALAETIASDIAHVSPETVVRRVPFEPKDAWDFEEVFGALHDIASSYSWKTDREDYLVHITTGTHVCQICLFLLTEARYLPAKLLQTSPPRRSARNPTVGTHNVIDLDLSRYDRILSRFKEDQRKGQSILKSGIATKNAAFNTMIARVEEISVASRAPILLLGPTGSGKSQLAKRIYALKKARRKLAGPFVEVNCATIRGDGAMSALFGHSKGAFTGAVSDREGLLRRADGGVLFLDEVGELGDDEQAMLLRAVEERAFYPVGSDREVKSDFELVAGTNKDLERSAARGEFRADLLARMNLWTFRLPALRERPEDIEPNLDYELDAAGREIGKVITMSREARARYLVFATSPEAIWPGNFRDLGASVTRMSTLAPGGRVTVPLVDEELVRLRLLFAAFEDNAPETIAEDHVSAVLGKAKANALDRFDRVQLEETLRICRRSASLSEAGRLLFAASRALKTNINDADRLRKYLARFELTFAAVKSTPGEVI
ncbi:MAG: RNA repair transcriptional activator RtcR [Polyangiaceae bacterium]|nr:RNA repair transcriptional activator RtcR [Polyangiaceae bacterium]